MARGGTPTRRFLEAMTHAILFLFWYLLFYYDSRKWTLSCGSKGMLEGHAREVHKHEGHLHEEQILWGPFLCSRACNFYVGKPHECEAYTCEEVSSYTHEGCKEDTAMCIWNLSSKELLEAVVQTLTQGGYKVAAPRGGSKRRARGGHFLNLYDLLFLF